MNIRNRIVKTWRAIAARPGFERVNNLLFDCAIHGLGIHNFESDHWSGEGHFIKRILPLYISPDAGSVAFDVGANEGSYSRLLAANFPHMQIYACEPNPSTFKILQRGSGSTITPINKGLGAVASRITLYDREDAQCGAQHASLYRDVITDVHKVNAVGIDVEITTLDALVHQHGITQAIALLKIDTEGHELEVLKGAGRTLNLSMIDVIHIEFNEMNVVSRVFFRDFRHLLDEFVPYRLLPNGAIPLQGSPLQTELFAFQNLVFINRRFRPDRAMRPTIAGPVRQPGIVHSELASAR